MTDQEAADNMIALLSGEPVTYVSYVLDGEVHQVAVVGGGTVKIPREATEAWYSWKRDSVLATEQAYSMDNATWRIWGAALGIDQWHAHYLNGKSSTVHFERE